MNTESELKIPDQSIHMAAYKIRLMLFHLRKEYLDEPGHRELEDIFAVMPGPKRQRTSNHPFLDFRPPLIAPDKGPPQSWQHLCRFPAPVFK